jgi:hypothetical protein
VINSRLTWQSVVWLSVVAAEDLRKQPKLTRTLYLASSADEMIPGVMQRFVDVLSKNAPPDQRASTGKLTRVIRRG